ncbi:MAG: outer membrane beta-barrel protein [Pseudomonadota bacterium]
MKKILTACAIAAATLVAAPAFAQGYIGAGLGSSKISGFDNGTIAGGNTSKGTAKIFGGFQFTPNWGMEVQYSDLGRRNLTNAGVAAGSMSTSQFGLSGTGTLPMSSGFSLLGKLGVSANRTTGAASANNTGLLIGVGVAYNFTPALSARLEYEDFGKVGTVAANGSTVRANAYSLNLKYAF